ncbi:unnamed protein product [Nippostrongylus brasiliensis]|uniref:Dystrophin-1 (inferred by orthology to a C. elegans protein) n=1 Tax=Nippostrongylus brasiliensis TaxID=27835 RepID=A0A0N4XL76_NIPBR|nr:unnamed protein product [Nippostrongylus brasiliensis]
MHLLSLRIRRAVLEATQRSRSDFHTAFADFEDWLGRIGQTVAELEEATANTQSLKDTAKRRDWIQQHKALEAELDAHESVLKAVDEMGRKLGAGLDSGKDRSEINNRLDSMAKRWADVRQMEGNIKNRLAEAEQEWEKLTNTLSNLISWIEDKSIEMLAQQPVGGSLSAVMAQGAWMKTTEKEMEQKVGLHDKSLLLERGREHFSFSSFLLSSLWFSNPFQIESVFPLSHFPVFLVFSQYNRRRILFVPSKLQRKPYGLLAYIWSQQGGYDWSS